MDDVSLPQPPRVSEVVVSSPSERPGYDPYAFPADESVPSSGASSCYHGGKPLLLSLHPKTFLPPGDPSPHATNIQNERDANSFQRQFSAFLHSPTPGAELATQNMQQFIHPSSKLENDSVSVLSDKLYAFKQTQCQPLINDSEMLQVQNSMITHESGLNKEKSKKKRKQKQVEDEVGEVAKASFKNPSPSFSLPPGFEKKHALPARDFCTVGSETHSELAGEHRTVGANIAASALSADSQLSDRNEPFQSVQSPGSSHTTLFLPTTTFSSCVQTVSEDRCQPTESVEFAASRPSSRTSTLSSSSLNSEGKTKDGTDAVSMSKIMQIIEREKKLGSSSPSKRRRTAKPQHIQEAEEEAKRYAAVNAVQGMITGAAVAEKSHSGQHKMKKSVQPDKSTVLPNEKTKGCSKFNSQVSNKNVPGFGSYQVSDNPVYGCAEKMHAPDNASASKVPSCVTPISDKVDFLSISSSGCLDPAYRVKTSSSVATETELLDSQFTYDNSNMLATNTTCQADHRDKILGPQNSSCITDIASVPITLSCSAPKNNHTQQLDQTVVQLKTEIEPSALYQSIPHTSDEQEKEKPLIQNSTGIRKLHYPHHDFDTFDKSINTSTVSAVSDQQKIQCGQKSIFGETLKEDSSSCVSVFPSSVASKGNLYNPQDTTHGLPMSQMTLPSSAQIGWCNNSQGNEVSNVAPDAASVTIMKDCLPSDHSPDGIKHISTSDKTKKKRLPNKSRASQLSSDSVLNSRSSPISALGPVPKKPKKKQPSRKVEISQFPLSSTDSLCQDALSSLGSLPPFDAFAGMKTDSVHPCLEYTSDGTQSNTSTSLDTGMTQQHSKVKSRFPSLITQSGSESADGTHVKNSLSHDTLRDSSNLKYIDNRYRSDLIASDESCQTVESTADTCTNSNIGADNVSNTRSVSDRSAFFNSDGVNIKSYGNVLTGFNLGNSWVTHQRIVAENKQIEVDSVCKGGMNGLPVADSDSSSDIKSRVNGVNLKHGAKDNDIFLQHVMGNDYKLAEKGFSCAGSSTEKASLEKGKHEEVVLPKNSRKSERIPTTPKTSSEPVTGVEKRKTTIIDPSPVKSSITLPPDGLPVDSTSSQIVFPLKENKTEIRAPPAYSKIPVSISPFRDFLPNDNKTTTSVKAASATNQKELKADSLVWGRKSDAAASVKTLFDLDSANGIKPTCSTGTCAEPVSCARKRKVSAGCIPNGTVHNFNCTVPHMNDSTIKPTPSPAPKQEPSIVHMTPEEELEDRLQNNKMESVPKCNCLGPHYEFNESVEGPYYTQLGKAKDIAGVRALMEKRTGLSGNAIRIEKVHYTGKEGRTQKGCPIAKWVIRRSGPEEKYLCVARHRRGHTCDAAFIVMVIVAWEGVASSQADSLYSYLVSSLTKHGFETDRRCGSNESKTCACQGIDLLRRGASFSFGCSWSMYYNGCKFARSNVVRKFKLKDTNEEEKIEEHLQNLATQVGPLYKVVAPDAYRNQVHFEEQASMCRLGKEKGRPFSGVTACVDFCAHSHKDFHNMQNGSTVVVTLTKHRGLSKPDDEQLHVLPLYILDNTDEHGSIEEQMKKVQSGALEVLQRYSVQARMRATPLKKTKRGAKKDSPAKTGRITPLSSPVVVSNSAPGTPTTPTAPPKERDTSFLQSQDSSQSLPDNCISGNNATMHSTEKKSDSSFSSSVDKENSSNPDDFVSQSSEPSELYGKVCEYYYTHGLSPPPSIMGQWAAAQKKAVVNSPANITNNGAKNHGSNVNSSHQTSSHPCLSQAANFQQSLSSQSVLHPHSPSCQPCASECETEAVNSVDIDHEHEVINITKGQDHGDLKTLTSISECASHIGRKENGTELSRHHISSEPQPVNTGSIGTPVRRHGSPLSLPSGAAVETGMVGNLTSPSNPTQCEGIPVHSCSCSASRSSVHPSSPGECNHNFDLMYSNLPHLHSSPGVHNSVFGSPSMNTKPNCDGTLAPTLCNDKPNCSTPSKPVMQPSESFVAPKLGQGPGEPAYAMIDPTVVQCEWQDNEENFVDPDIGGVAISLTHGAVLFEVAKRELHATTALKNPNRFQPTRVSLVFYQHKNLNFFHHGYHEYERKLSAQRRDRIKKMMEEGATAEEAEQAVKPGRKRKRKATDTAGDEEEKIDFAKTSAAQYKYMWDTTVRHDVSLTTDSIITRWIDPQPMVTGPYQRWV